MIDGQPQWAGVFGHSLADTYVANGVEKVEVVKGPSSLLYGSNAMGGSINLVTHTQTKDGLTGRARAMFGSFSTQKFALSSGYKKDRFSATLSGQLDRSNGNRAGSAFWLANEFLQLKYAVSDHCPAIDPATAESIFIPFFTTRPDGQGIGLPLCRQIMKAQGGSVTLRPYGESSLTVFRISFF